VNIFKPFRGSGSRAKAQSIPSSDLWGIDLGPVDEPMANGHATERMDFTTTERISLGKAAKRAVAQPIGKPAERNFDWQSVQSPEDWRDEPADPRADDAFGDDAFREAFREQVAAPPAPAPRAAPPPRHAVDRLFDRPAEPPPPPRALDRVFAPGPAKGPAAHGLKAVVGEAGVLTVHGVQKSFGSRMVVKGVSLAVRRGEAVGLLGPNGAGKTTVFYMITGLIPADQGKIQFENHDITHLPMYQRARLGIGYLPQEASIFRGLNVEDNIRAVLEVVEPSKKKREMELDRLLEEFNITRLRKTPSIALSGGERRRTEIARALATRPAYMLLDEPFAGIDPIAVGDIQDLVRHLKERGIGVLITDHNVRETLGLTDRAYIIYSGEVLREGNAEDIINDPEVRRLYLGEEFRM
jgi:lipopolysaccharide export system ATP-binding protein